MIVEYRENKMRRLWVNQARAVCLSGLNTSSNHRVSQEANFFFVSSWTEIQKKHRYTQLLQEVKKLSLAN